MSVVDYSACLRVGGGLEIAEARFNKRCPKIRNCYHLTEIYVGGSNRGMLEDLIFVQISAKL